MEICPECSEYSLSLDLRNGLARCYNRDCCFKEEIIDYDDYFKRFVISELNWANYCAQTPASLRVPSPHLRLKEDERELNKG
jgi:transcription initiation factor TFIIIB Brf1 subunit/transcription initiation factor TFIIB